MKKSIDKLLKNKKIQLLSKEYMSGIKANDEAMLYYFEYSTGYMFSE